MERDDSNIRLFIFRLQQKGLNIHRLYALNEKIYVIETKFGFKVLKGFESKSKLLFQFAFSQKLLEREQRLLYYFERFPNGDRYAKWNQFYWALIPFIFGSKVNFAKKMIKLMFFKH